MGMRARLRGSHGGKGRSGREKPKKLAGSLLVPPAQQSRISSIRAGKVRDPSRWISARPDFRRKQAFSGITPLIKRFEA